MLYHRRMAFRVIVTLLMLAGCSAYPQVDWPPGPAGPTPALLPLDSLAVEGSTLDSRGAALAAQAAALRARAAMIGK